MAHTASVRENLRQELLGTLRLGVLEELVGRATFENLAVGHEHDLIGRLARKTISSV